MRGSFVWGAAAGSVIGAVAAMVAMPYMKPQVKKFKKGYLSKVDLLDFYQREEIRAKYKLISKEIESLGNE